MIAVVKGGRGVLFLFELLPSRLVNYRRHFEQVSAATGDLLNATVRLEVVSRRLGERYAASRAAKEA